MCGRVKTNAVVFKVKFSCDCFTFNPVHIYMLNLCMHFKLYNMYKRLLKHVERNCERKCNDVRAMKESI